MLARRVAALLVAAVLAWLGLGDASAQSYPFCRGDYTGSAQCPDAVTAHQTARDATMLVCNGYGSSAPCIGLDGFDTWTSDGRTYVQYSFKAGNLPRQAGPQRYWSGSACPPGQEFNPFTLSCGTACASRPNLTSEFYPKSGSTQCIDGCEVVWFRNGDGTSTQMHLGNQCNSANYPETCAPGGAFWNPILNTCEPLQAECPAGQTKNSRGECAPEACPAGMVMGADGTCSSKENECPAGNVKAPSGECLPGDGQCAAGEVRRENGTCGKDGDGDGVADVDDDDPDNDPKESASGGDTCDAPPACNGGAIDCMQVRIQWRIDCNTRRNRNVSGGSCAAIPVCTGEKCDAMEYAQLLQQWRATCALEKIAARDGTGGGGGDAGVVDLLTGPGSINSNAGGGDSLEDGNPWADEGEEYEPDASGYGWSRSCPSPPSFTLPGGHSVQINLTPLCNWVSLGGSLVLILAGLLSLRIVSGGNA